MPGGLRSLRSLRPLPQSASPSLCDNSHLAGPFPYTCPEVDKPPGNPYTSLNALGGHFLVLFRYFNSYWSRIVHCIFLHPHESSIRLCLRVTVPLFEIVEFLFVFLHFFDGFPLLLTKDLFLFVHSFQNTLCALPRQWRTRQYRLDHPEQNDARIRDRPQCKYRQTVQMNQYNRQMILPVMINDAKVKDNRARFL